MRRDLDARVQAARLHTDLAPEPENPLVFHPWRCAKGHANRSELPPEASEGARRRIVLRCAEAGCTEHTAIFVGSANDPRRPKPPSK